MCANRSEQALNLIEYQLPLEGARDLGGPWALELPFLAATYRGHNTL